MRENLFRQAIDEGKPSVGMFLALGSPFAAEVIASSGIDWVCIDLQHGMFDFGTALSMMQAVASTPCSPIVRVPSLDVALIGKVLDAGAHGIVVPAVQSAEQVTQIVRACKYPPRGERSIGPSRSGMYWNKSSEPGEASEPVIVAMIETNEGANDIARICQTSGLDAILIGTVDLKADLKSSAAQVQKGNGGLPLIINSISQSCKQNGVRCGIFIQEVNEMHDNLLMGMTFFPIRTDIHVVGDAALSLVQESRRIFLEAELRMAKMS